MSEEEEDSSLLQNEDPEEEEQTESVKTKHQKHGKGKEKEKEKEKKREREDKKEAKGEEIGILESKPSINNDEGGEGVKLGEEIEETTATLVPGNDSTVPANGEQPAAVVAAAAAEEEDPEAKRQREEQELIEEMKFYAEQIYLLIIPIFSTFALTIWFSRAIFLDNNIQSNFALLVYQEEESDSTGLKIGGAILNALIILGCLLVVTVIFVVLFYYNCMKIIFGWLITSTVIILGGIGGIVAYYLFFEYNFPMDWLTFVVVLWNFSVVGLLSVFWKSPLYIQQGYLVLISAFVAVNLLQLPEWTGFALLGVVAIYDLFAVLCPKGPLKVLVNTAQERNQPIPGLLYSAGMADVGKVPKTAAGVYTALINEENDAEDFSTQNPSSHSDSNSGNTYHLSTVEPGHGSSSSSQGGQGQDQPQDGAEEQENNDPANPQQGKSSKFRRRVDPETGEEDDEPAGVQLGLGDFIFYSVLVGRASLTDWITIITCAIACITGLCLTLLLLGIYRKALPALPISIALGITFYFLTSLILTPYNDVLGQEMVFV